VTIGGVPRRRRAAPLAAAATLIASACGGEEGPSKGSYTVQFPSTAAAVATDFVQVLVFAVTPEQRDNACADLVSRRRTDPGSLVPSVNPPAANICEMLAGQKPIEIPYGEHAVLAIAQRRDAADVPKDFLIGCEVMTIDFGDAPVAIPVAPIDAEAPIPETSCQSVRDFCDEKCQ
jgi:hypothetical protein